MCSMEPPTNEMDSLAVDATKKEDVVNPWTVTSVSEKGVDYEKLISKFIIHFCTILEHCSIIYEIFRTIW